MKTQQLHSTKQKSQLKEQGDKNMNSTVIRNDNKRTEYSVLEDNIQSEFSKENTQVNRDNKHSVLFDIICTILVIFIGLAVYKTTGLYNGIDSTTGKIILGALISFLYVSVFRHALYRR